VSDYQASVSDMKKTGGEDSAAEMISEMMGLVVACGLMIGAIVGVMVIQIGFRDSFQGGNDVLVGSLAGGAIGAVVSWAGMWLAERMAGKASR
jgi:hypothetical protein